MGNNWSSELERRRAGEVPGFIGTDEDIADFEKRHAAEQRGDVADGSVTVDAGVGANPASRVSVKKAAAKRTAKATAAKKR